MRRYETVVVLSVVGGEQELKDEIKKLETFIASKGAKNLNVERAGTKELGYKMKKQSVGHYVYFKYEVEAENNSKDLFITEEMAGLLENLRAELDYTQLACQMSFLTQSWEFNWGK